MNIKSVGLMMFGACFAACAMDSDDLVNKINKVHPSLNKVEIDKLIDKVLNSTKNKSLELSLEALAHVLTPADDTMNSFGFVGGFHLANTKEARGFIDKTLCSYDNGCYEAAWKCFDSNVIRQSTHFPQDWTYDELVNCMISMHAKMNQDNISARYNKLLIRDDYVDSSGRKMNVVLVLQCINKIVTLYPKQAVPVQKKCNRRHVNGNFRGPRYKGMGGYSSSRNRGYCG
jgi:hypothetical protein